MTSTDIIKAVAQDYGVEPADLTGKSRADPLPEARGVLVWLLRYWTQMSYPDIIRECFSTGSHSTAVDAARRTEQRMLMDESFRQRVQRINRAIQGATT